jgi:penicillin amidase
MNFADRIWGGAVAAALAARALLVPRPRPIDTAARLAMLPLADAPVAHPVSIRWDVHQIPFVTADSDTDLAAALGVVHGHLRLGQIDLMRRLSLGRVSEMIGPLGVELDRTIHLMDLSRAAPGIIASLPPATLAWAEAFVAGLNHAIAASPVPYECRLLGVRPAPFTLADFFTLSRLISADISWMVGARLLRARTRAGTGWPALWPKLLAGGAPPTLNDPDDAAADLLARHVRGGSNSAAIAGFRAANRGAMIASDPHLGLGLPNNWLIAGVRSPGFACVGLMLPGMPFMALGRNDHIAWGGTSLHAASSELIDVSGVPDSHFSERRVKIRVRGAGTRVLRLRESPYGPVVSDGLLLKNDRPLALRWVGHAPSDELTAMLGVMRARSFEDFSAALDGFAVPGQTMLCAGADGRVGKRAAVHMPRRPRDEPADLIVQPEDAWDFSDVAGGADMPVWTDPKDGIVASANEQPDKGDISLGFFFSPPDRARRLREILAAPGVRTIADMQALPLDVLHSGALPVRDELLRLIDAAPADFVTCLEGWDGRYGASSRGALAYELLIGHLMRRLFPPDTVTGFNAVWGTRLLLLREMRQIAPPLVEHAVATVLNDVVRAWRRWRDWGGVHRYRPAHHFSALPVLGRRFRSAAFPAPGGDDTLHKTGHGFVTAPHFVRFGACARHVSDMADPDANFFVLLGGQDGWLGSTNFYDQVPLWKQGAYIAVPLAEASVGARFVHETVLRPRPCPGIS